MRELIDKDGDHWYERRGGQWFCNLPTAEISWRGDSLSSVEKSWGPVQFVATGEPERAAPPTDILEDLESLIDEFENVAAAFERLYTTSRQLTFEARAKSYREVIWRLEQVIRGDNL